MDEIDLNDKLPSFSLEATMINTCNDTDFRGQWTVLYIYPKDNTSGCTRETKEFNDEIESEIYFEELSGTRGNRGCAARRLLSFK